MPKDPTDPQSLVGLLVAQTEVHAIVALDPHGRIVAWNVGAERTTGYPASEMIGRHYADYTATSLPDAPEPHWALNVASAEGRFENHGWRTRKDGVRYWSESVLTALYDPQRNLLGYGEVSRDFTTRKWQEERFRAAVESSPNAIVMVNREGKIVLVNAQAIKMFGYTRPELLGRTIEMLVPQRFRPQHPDLRKGFFHDPRTRAMGAGRDLYGLRKDGTEIPVEIGLNPIKTDEGDFVLAAIVDITERRKAEEERTRAEERFRVAVESSPNAIVMVNREGKIVLVNVQTEKLFGYARNELLGETVEKLVPNRFHGAHPGYRGAFFHDPRTRAMGAGRDLYGLRKDGTEVPVEIGLNPIKTDEGDFVLAAIVDITERRRMELDRVELDRAKTDFFSNVSHEFRTPLTLLLGPLEDLMREDRGLREGRTRGQLEVVHRSALRLLKLVNSLLDFSRIEAGRAEASYEPLDLAEVTRELASVFRSAIERAKLRYQVECPPVGEPVWVDREMWEKIVFNLLSNAFKFTFEGEIEVGLRRQGTRVELSVRDTGVGITSDQIPRLFERFHRVRNTRSRTQEGTGIGLALVQELAKLHGGTVRVASEPGRGSTFAVSLPLGSAHLPRERIVPARELAPASQSAAPYLVELGEWMPREPAPESAHVESQPAAATPAAGPPAPPAPPGGPGTARILLAEDNADLRDYLGDLLAEQWQVEGVADGRAALRAARERRPDLVLSDVLMPEMNGFELLRELRADPSLRTVPVILVSARAGEESQVEGLEAGADDYLVKPFSARELVARVRSNLELSRLRRQAEAEARRVNEELEARVQERTAQLRESIAELETFTYSVAHDLRAPLRAVHRFCDLLLEEKADRLDDEGKDYTRRARDGAARMDLLIQNLLGYSRVTRATIRLQPVPLDRVVAAATAELAVEIAERRAQVEVSAGMPEVQGDAVLLSQAVTNLLSNALKFVPPGEPPRVQIRAGEVAAGGPVRLWVEDEGIGVPVKYRNRLFHVFERLHTREEYPGTGIGLAIVRRAVERMGGTVGFDPAEPRGTRFWIELPPARNVP